MKNTTLLLSEGASIDKNTNQWSVFNHIETFSIDDPKKEQFELKGKFVIVSFWRKQEGDNNKFFEVVHEFVNKDGKSLTKHPPIDIEVKSNSKTFKQRIQINAIPFSGEGEYFLKALIKEKGEDEFEEAAKIPIKLKYNK